MSAFCKTRGSSEEHFGQGPDWLTKSMSCEGHMMKNWIGLKQCTLVSTPWTGGHNRLLSNRTEFSFQNPSTVRKCLHFSCIKWIRRISTFSEKTGTNVVIAFSCQRLCFQVVLSFCLRRLSPDIMSFNQKDWFPDKPREIKVSHCILNRPYRHVCVM